MASMRPGRIALLGAAFALVAATVAAQGIWGRRDWPMGDAPRSVVVADLDGDALPDVATADEAAGTVSVRWGQTRGSFSPAVAYPVGAGPVFLAVGDMNGDGREDLITANSFGASVSVLVYNGSRTFLAAASYGALSAPSSIAVADLDGDGFVDLAVTDQSSGRVVVLDPVHGFLPVGDYGVGSGPASVAAADLDGDGWTDLVTANQGSGTVSVLRNVGAGVFAPKADYGAGSAPRCVAPGDLNRDGVPDLVVANQDSDSLSVLLNTGAGTFLPAASYAVGAGPRSVTLADLNEDGALDAAVASAAAGNVSVLLNSGLGTFAAPVAYDVGTEPVSVAARDSNGDGTVDLAVANRADDSVSVLPNSGTGSFALPATFATGTQPRALALGDFDSDGVLDVAVARASNAVAVLRGSGLGTFGAPVSYPVGTNPSSLALGDLNGDGKLDIVVANYGPNASSDPDSISVLLNAGDGTFAAAVGYGVDDKPFSIAIGDVDRDGDADVVVAHDGTSIRVLRNVGNGTLTPGVNQPSVAGPRGIALADLDGDGDLDLAVAGSDAAVIQNLGVGLSGEVEWGAPATYSVGNTPWSVTVADLDADGRPDLAIPNFYSGTVSVLLHTPSPGIAYSPAVHYAVGDRPTSVAASDLDGDGFVDLAVANSYSDGVSVLLDAGASAPGTFGLAASYASGTTPYSVAAADLNGDGPVDLVVAGYGSGNVTVHRGFRARSVHVHAASGFEYEGSLVFHVHLAAPSGATATVHYQTVPGTASEGADYTAASGTLTFASGETAKTVVVPVVADAADEEDETVTLRLLPPWDVLVPERDAVGTILDDDPGGVIEIDQATYTVGEGAGTVTIGIRRRGPLGAAASVGYLTLAGTATPGLDYTAASGQLAFAPGQSSATVSIPILVDALDESPEHFTFRIASPSAGARLGATRSARVTIVDGNNTLTVTRAGAGAGVVVSAPVGISCGADCAESYATGTSVILTAAPAVGVAFAGWSGDCTGPLPTCSLTMSVDRSTIATFNCAPIFAPASRIHSAARGEGNTIAVSTSGGCSWGAVVTPPSATWLVLTAGTSGSGSGTVQYTVQENTGETARTATIEINGHDFTVTQYPPQVASATTITSLSATTRRVGQPVDVGVAVASSLGPGTTPTGSVTVSDGVDSCTATLSAGAGSCSLALSLAGTRNLVASYSGDPRHLPSSSPASPIAVETTATTTTITADAPDASFVGQTVTVGFVVAPQAPGGGAPIGTVTVDVEPGAESCSGTLIAADAGVGSCTIQFAAPGAKTLTAGFAPATPVPPSDPFAYAASVSAAVSHDVVTSTIDTTADVVAVDGKCSLREAVQAANANGVVNECGYQSYTFAVTGTITLASALPAVTGALTLTGPGASQLTLSGAGAARLFEVAAGGSLSLSGLTLADGRAVDGGAVLNAGTLAITDSVLEGNEATGYGGALISYGPLTIQGTTLSSNTATEGGALDVEYGRAVVTRTTISGNAAASVGGAIWNGGTLSLTSVTLAANTAPTASAIYARDPVALRSSIVAGSCIGGSTDGGYNLESGSSCGLVASTSRANADPLLLSLGDNGGPTPTHALPAGSPAIDAGSAAACAEAAPTGAGGRDQRGVAHVGTCDVGAYESPFTPTTTVLGTSGASVFGQPVTLTATVSGASSPTGSVVFRAGAAALGAPVAVDGSGVAVLVTAALPVGTHALSAAYQGDGSHNASTSSVLSQVVSRAGTTTGLAQSAATSVYGQTVTLTATLAAVAPGQGTPAGNVVFRDGATTLGSVALAGGSASLSLVRPAVGTHLLSAEYGGSVSHAGSVSTSVSHVVSAKPVVPQAVWHAWFAVDTLETPYVGDFNGDGMTDIVTFTRQNPSAVGDVYVSLSNGREFVDRNGVPNSSDKWNDWFAISTDETVIVGDYDGDGKDDIATWLGRSTRQVYVALSTGTGMRPAAVWLGSIGSDPSDVILAGDANGDGRQDLVCFARKLGKVYVALSQGTSFQAPAEWHAWFAVSTYERPRLADVNGDGRADIVTFATDSPTAQGDVYVALSNGTRFVDKNGAPNSSDKWHDWFAVSASQQVRVGDVDADGKDDFFTFLGPPFAQCYTVRSQGTGMGPNELWPESVAPLATDVPYVGDADGDGKADVIVFAQSEGKVYVSLGR